MSLRLDLQLEPRRAQRGEGVVALVTLKNIGATSILFNARMALNHETAPEPYRDVSFAFTTPPGYGHTVAFAIRLGDPSPDDFRTLPARESITRRYDLTRYYPLDEPGRYEVVARYTNVHAGPPGRPPAWTGTLSSQPCELVRQA